MNGRYYGWWRGHTGVGKGLGWQIKAEGTTEDETWDSLDVVVYGVSGDKMVLPAGKHPWDRLTAGVSR